MFGGFGKGLTAKEYQARVNAMGGDTSRSVPAKRGHLKNQPRGATTTPLCVHCAPKKKPQGQ